MSLLNVSVITKKEGENYVVENINFAQKPFQKIAIAGATGSGKTTLLKIIAGLVQPDSGEVLFEGARVKGPNEKLIPGHPQIAYLSQHFELRNHYRVEELLQMANKLSNKDAEAIFDVCRISHLLHRWSNELSGGERQRIALAKLLITSPKLLLLDEPFSNLDAIHKALLKKVISDIGEQLTIGCLLVSHDPVDVLSWADEIMVLHQGHIVQRGSPEELYHQPSGEYIAALFGKFNLLNEALKKVFSYQGHKRFFRPEDFSINTNGEASGKVVRSGFMGSFYEIEVEVEQSMLLVHSNKPFNKGDEVCLSLMKEK